MPSPLRRSRRSGRGELPRGGAGEFVPEAPGRLRNTPARLNQVEQAVFCNFMKHTLRVGGKAGRQGRSFGTVLRTTRLEKIRAVQHSSDPVPLGKSHGVVPDRVEHSTIGLSFGLRAGRAGRSVEKLSGSRRRGSQLLEFLHGSISKRIVQPHGTKPASALRIGNPDVGTPFLNQRGDPLNVLKPRRSDLRPGRQGRHSRNPGRRARAALAARNRAG